MKMLLATIAVESVFAAPQYQDAQTSRRDWSSGVHVYAPDHYTVWHGNQNANPDFQLSYSRWALSTEDHFTRIGGA